MFSSISGKLCKKGSTYIALNKKTGQMYSAEYHERTQPNSDGQQEAKSVFISKSKTCCILMEHQQAVRREPKWHGELPTRVEGL